MGSEIFSNGIRVFPINLFYNTAFEYYLCHFTIDRSDSRTARGRYIDLGVFLEFCGVMPQTHKDTLTVIPKNDSQVNDLGKKVLSWLKPSKNIETGNYLVDRNYEIESTSDAFAKLILNTEMINALSKSDSISLSIRDGAVFCGTGRDPKTHDLLLLKRILEQIPTGLPVS
jgi:hypothetical protein